MNKQACPDDLVMRSREGTLSPEERVKLDAHLSHCRECETTLLLARDFDEVLGARSGDDQIATRIAARLTRTPVRPRRRGGLLFAAILLGSVGAAAGSHPTTRGLLLSAFTKVEGAQTVNASASELPLPPHQTSSGAEEPPPAAVEATPEPPPEEKPTPAEEPHPAPTAKDTAAELFSAANDKRRTGSAKEAKSLYLKLQRQYPSSSEALVSHVSLGRMLRGGSPQAALRHFDAYLSQSHHTTLAEEALFGKASALSSLGRQSQALEAYQQLLRRFPSSVYAETAKAKLAPGP